MRRDRKPDPTALCVAVMVGDKYGKARLLKTTTYRMEHDGKWLNLNFRMDVEPDSYVEGGLTETEEAEPECPRRLYFNSDNQLGEFRVRVYRSEVTSGLWRRQFNHPIDPRTML